MDFDFFGIDVFNQRVDSENIIMTIDSWRNIHLLLKTVPVDWDHTVPFGLRHARSPSPAVQSFLDAAQEVLAL